MIDVTKHADWREFDDMMRRNVAKMTTFSRPYVSRLRFADIEALYGDALVIAWNTRTELRNATQLLTWWDRCLRAAAERRRFWKLRRWDGWDKVRGTALGGGKKK